MTNRRPQPRSAFSSPKKRGLRKNLPALRNGALAATLEAQKQARVRAATAVLAGLGGLSKTARALSELGNGKVAVTTVESWRRNGIPRWRWPALREVARRRGVRLPKDPSSNARDAGAAKDSRG